MCLQLVSMNLGDRHTVKIFFDRVLGVGYELRHQLSSNLSKYFITHEQVAISGEILDFQHFQHLHCSFYIYACLLSFCKFRGGRLAVSHVNLLARTT